MLFSRSTVTVISALIAIYYIRVDYKVGSVRKKKWEKKWEGLVHATLQVRDGAQSRYDNVYVQYWYLIPHYQLVLNHQLQVACIRGSRTLCVPLPADMNRTSQRGRRNPSRLGQAALIYRA